MRWLDDNFQTIEASTSDVEKEQSARAFILRLMGDLLMPDKFRNLVHLKWLLQLVNLREAGRLSWRSAVLATLSEDLRMRPGEIFGQPQHLARESVIGRICNGRDARIRPSDAAHRYDYLPTCEPYLTSEFATSSNYMDWFRHYGKLCLLPTLERSKQYLCKRPIRGPINPKSRGHVADRLTFAPHAHPDPVPVQPPDQTPLPASYYTPYASSPHATPYSGLLIVSQTPPTTLFFRVGSSSKTPTRSERDALRLLGHGPSHPRMEEIRSLINPNVHMKTRPKSQWSRQLKQCDETLGMPDVHPVVAYIRGIDGYVHL
ncbi:hypothetical protein Gotur_001891 [Gossypium turneri]